MCHVTRLTASCPAMRRATTSFFAASTKTGMAGTSPAMTMWRDTSRLRSSAFAAFAMISATLVPQPAAAQNLQDGKPIRVIVGLAAGGATD